MVLDTRIVTAAHNLDVFSKYKLTEFTNALNANESKITANPDGSPDGMITETDVVALYNSNATFRNTVNGLPTEDSLKPPSILRRFHPAYSPVFRVTPLVIDDLRGSTSAIPNYTSTGAFGMLFSLGWGSARPHLWGDGPEDTQSGRFGIMWGFELYAGFLRTNNLLYKDIKGTVPPGKNGNDIVTGRESQTVFIGGFGVYIGPAVRLWDTSAGPGGLAITGNFKALWTVGNASINDGQSGDSERRDTADVLLGAGLWLIACDHFAAELFGYDYDIVNSVNRPGDINPKSYDNNHVFTIFGLRAQY